MLKVISVTATLSHGGAEKHALGLTRRLAERGHQTHAIHIKDGTDQLDRVRLPEGVTVDCLDAKRYFDRPALAEMASQFTRVRPSAVVATNAYALMYSSLALRLSRLRVPLVVTYHSNRLLGAKEHLQMALYRLFFWTADCSVFVCHRQRRYWLGRGVFSRRNEVIYNGVDIDEFCENASVDERRSVRHALGFVERDYVIGVPALLRREKNHVQLVDAVARLRAVGIPARALMVGDGEMRPAIESRARALGVEPSVAITGLQKDVRPFIRACDAVALCSLTEAFSLAAIEAMALGKPVVHSDVGGAAEMIVPGRNGFLFPVGDTRALVHKLAALVDRSTSRSMGRAARAVVESRFSERAMVDRYEKVLLELAGDGTAQSLRPSPEQS